MTIHPSHPSHPALPAARGIRTTPEGLAWEPSERWVRGVKGEVTVVDSRHPVLVWEPDVPVPLYAFPREEVREDLLRPAKNPPTGAHTGSSVFYDLDVDGAVVENAAWTFPAEDLAGHIAFEWFRHWHSGLDHWYEEEQEIFIHPRDPHKRVDAVPSSRHVQVEVGGMLVADTRKPVLVFETSLPTRYYIPREDVRLDLFVPTDHSTGCPYKGTARYWAWRGEGDVPRNILWSYPAPLPQVAAVQGLLAFYNEAVDITVDGERLPRPVTPFTESLKKS
ncbi:hypothetical protein SLINC_1239 [Streptomyces lincolnensis]|uniref:Uncharacterized protein n=1 Tax=Streptomyces lincolnensis TaxID=1915 RepID=A0A1B1M4W3_STRLN|nr:DUF427 domain-containing protein [Streptomyces lincolnensis]ANS63463.1 hypothetical protein SLINC_1239 [Streptomyces lincolnensis]AXG52385.1 hypothetical protein SLCG_1230 [Streptomyces lincolnensis]QMV05345.1 DUF427 domain-containing protein [Streptomyces lincolnensis]